MAATGTATAAPADPTLIAVPAVLPVPAASLTLLLLVIPQEPSPAAAAPQRALPTTTWGPFTTTWACAQRGASQVKLLPCSLPF